MVILYIGLIVNQVMYTGEEMVVFQNEDTPLVQQGSPEQNKKLLKHLTINNAINGAIVFSGLITLGVTSVTGTNNYPLTTISTLAIGSLVQACHQYYITRKLYNNNINTENRLRTYKLVASGAMDIVMNGIGTALSIAAQLSEPKVNNLSTNILLLYPSGCFGYFWTSIFQNHKKYKKLQRTL